MPIVLSLINCVSKSANKCWGYFVFDNQNEMVFGFEQTFIPFVLMYYILSSSYKEVAFNTSIRYL